jgi:flagellin
MAIRINYNPMSVLTHRNLVAADRMMSGVLDRMSSGERLRRSADDPAAMVVANAVRYHRTGVDRAQSNAEEIVTMLQTAEGSMDEITQVLQRIRTLAVAALSDATQDPSQLQALQDELDAGIASITTVAQSTTFGGLALLNGSLHDNTLSADARAQYQSIAFDYTKMPGGAQNASTISIDPATLPMSRSFTVDSFGADTPASTPAFGGSGPVTITGPKGTVTLNLPDSMSIGSLVSAVNSATAITGVIAGYDPATGELTYESTSFGPSPLVIDTSASTIFGIGLNPVTDPSPTSITVSYIDAQGNPQTAQLEQDLTSPDGRTFVNVEGGPEAFPPYTGFAPGAISLVVKDTSKGGIGAIINPAFDTLTATRSGTTAAQIGALSSQRVTIDLQDMRAGALGGTAGLAGSGFGSLADLATVIGPPLVPGAFLSGNAGEALQLIDSALNEVNRARGAAGALQGNTVERVMDTLRVSSVNLREFEGILRDVDIAAESAEYSRVQVMIQAATAMLAQANQVPQTVLQLLK